MIILPTWAGFIFMGFVSKAKIDDDQRLKLRGGEPANDNQLDLFTYEADTSDRRVA